MKITVSDEHTGSSGFIHLTISHEGEKLADCFVRQSFVDEALEMWAEMLGFDMP